MKTIHRKTRTVLAVGALGAAIWANGDAQAQCNTLLGQQYFQNGYSPRTPQYNCNSSISGYWSNAVIQTFITANNAAGVVVDSFNSNPLYGVTGFPTYYGYFYDGVLIWCTDGNNPHSTGWQGPYTSAGQGGNHFWGCGPNGQGEYPNDNVTSAEAAIDLWLTSGT